jgi:hypothetical protein
VIRVGSTSDPMSRGNPIVVPIEDEFSSLAPAEQARLTAEWLHSLAQREPVTLPAPSAELVAEARLETDR